MKILVTGGAGFIGSNFVRHVMAKDPSLEVVVLDKMTYAGNLENLTEVSSQSRFSFVKGDICDEKVVRSTMEGCDIVLNFAAETHVDRSIGDPGSFVTTDMYGAYVLLEAAKDLGVARFVQISAVLGKSTMQVNQLLKLGRGAVVELDRKVGEAIDIYVNDRLVARGHLEEQEGETPGQLAVRLTEIADLQNGLG